MFWYRSCIASFALSALCCCASTLKLTTEHLPPFNIVAEDGQSVSGVAADRVIEMMHRAKINYRLLPSGWNRAYTLALSQADTCVFSVTRLPEREALFTWVALLAVDEIKIYARADFKSIATNLADIRHEKVSVYRSDSSALVLTKAQQELLYSESYEGSLASLLSGRANYWAAGNISANNILNRQQAQAKVRALFTFHHNELYLACNPGVAPDVIERLRSAYGKMDKDGSLRRIDQLYAE